MNTENDVLGLIPSPRFAKINAGFYDVPYSGTQIEKKLVESAAMPFSQIEKSIIEKSSKSSISAESYIMDILPDSVVVYAAGEAGFFYAEQTLRQLRTNYPEKLPCMHIEDVPAYEWRGFMLDCVRHFYPVEFILKIIDSLAMHKLNRFHWHLTDDQGWRLEVPEYPLLTEVGAWRNDHRKYRWHREGGFYTADDVKKVVEYAAERFITVVPEIETPGHASAILASYPELGCTGGPYNVEDRWGIFDDVLCAGNDKIFEVYGKVFDRVCELFPGKYVHIGGDECPRKNWKKCPKCQQRMKDEGLHSEDELQSWLTVRFSKMLEERGKIPLGWDEVLDGTERLGLPKSMMVQSWRGTKGGIKAASSGHNVVMSPNTNGCYLDYKQYDSPLEPGMYKIITTKKSYNFSPVPKGMPEDAAERVLGGQGNLWTETIYAARIAEYMTFPRLCAIAEALWLPAKEKNFASFKTRLETHKKRLDAMDILYYKGPLE